MNTFRSEQEWQRLITIAHQIKRLEEKDNDNRIIILDRRFPYLSVQERDKILSILG